MTHQPAHRPAAHAAVPRPSTVLAAMLAVLLALPTSSRAQDPEATRRQACADALASLGVTILLPGADRCSDLAGHINTVLTERARGRSTAKPQVSPRVMQSRSSGNAGGTTGSEAVATTQPTALAGGTLAAFGGDGGADAIAAISLNPFTLLAGGDDPYAARHLDLTLLAPTGNDADSMRYLGLRVRINLESQRQRQFLDSAQELFAAGTSRLRELRNGILALLKATGDPLECARELLSGESLERTKAACGATFDPLQYVIASRAYFDDFTAALRDSLDQHYFGLDLRYDRGDPTFGAVPGLDGTFLYAGVAFGKRTRVRATDGATFGWRARLAGQYVAVDSGPATTTDANGLSADVAFALEATYPAAFRPIRLIGGLEYRSGSPLPTTTDDALELDGLRWRLSLDIPVTAANGIALAYSTPLSGGGRPTLNVSFNWQMLLRDLSP